VGLGFEGVVSMPGWWVLKVLRVSGLGVFALEKCPQLAPSKPYISISSGIILCYEGYNKVLRVRCAARELYRGTLKTQARIRGVAVGFEGSGERAESCCFMASGATLKTLKTYPGGDVFTRRNAC
jgi:hypothetical protein